MAKPADTGPLVVPETPRTEAGKALVKKPGWMWTDHTIEERQAIAARIEAQAITTYLQSEEAREKFAIAFQKADYDIERAKTWYEAAQILLSALTEKPA